MISIVILTGFIFGLYQWYIASITENHTLIVDDYQIDLGIKMDDIFLDAQDDYSFSFSYVNQPQKQVSLQINDCLSRCWVLSKSAEFSNKLLLEGCNFNTEQYYIIDLNKLRYTRMKIRPEGFVLIDTLTNLYTDEQLPIGYNYKRD